MDPTLPMMQQILCLLSLGNLTDHIQSHKGPYITVSHAFLSFKKKDNRF